MIISDMLKTKDGPTLSPMMQLTCLTLALALLQIWVQIAACVNFDPVESSRTGPQPRSVQGSREQADNSTDPLARTTEGRRQSERDILSVLYSQLDPANTHAFSISTTKKGEVKASCSYLGITDIRSIKLDHPGLINVLDLKGNRIKDIPAGVWIPFVNLTNLDLSQNLLSHLHSNSFTNLTNLKTLNLARNGLHMTRENYPEQVFQPLVTLLNLHINDNTIAPEFGNQSYPDWALANVPSLLNLYIDGLPSRSFGPGFRKMRSLRYVSMNGYEGVCSLGLLKNETFVNVPQLRVLKMKRCKIHINKIESGVLSPLSKLEALDVSRNVDINLDGLIPLLHGVYNSPNLRHLNVDLVVNPYSVSRCVSNELAANLPRSLEYLDASSNNLEIVSDNVFGLLPRNLSYVTLNGNRFFFGVYLKNMSLMSNLKVLKMNGWIRGYDLPTYFGAADQQPVWKCDYGQRGTPEKIVLKLPPKLEIFEANLAALSLTLTQFSVDPNNSLKHVSAYGNNIPSLIGCIKGLKKLEFLDLSSNNIKYISPMFFFVSKIKILNLSNNDIGRYLSGETPRLIFPPSLRLLNLSHIPAYDIHTDFQLLRSLETLDLNKCNLRYFSANLTSATGLKHLDLSDNSLYTLGPNVTQAINQLENLTINLSGNRIGCFCFNLPFIDWLVHYPRLTDKNLSTLWCDRNGEMKKIADFQLVYHVLERECASNLLLLSVCMSLTVSALLLIFLLMMYRFRWQVRFWYYSAYLYLRSSDQGGVASQFRYDVNVAYCRDDEDFAEETLHDALATYNLKVRIPGRDALVGADTFKEIVEAVQACRRTLVVLTPKMIASKACQATINMAAQEQLHSGRPVLLFLVVKSVTTAMLGKELLCHIVSSDVCFFPPEENRCNERVMNLFWRKLAKNLS